MIKIAQLVFAASLCAVAGSSAFAQASATPSGKSDTTNGAAMKKGDSPMPSATTSSGTNTDTGAVGAGSPSTHSGSSAGESGTK